ncbi:hypothetical protein [Kineococcus siccus]|uniref:hypothetical protein n=1 Tax=Kineococcus siccus TaxID=2696567 RepID=UPI00196A6AD7|nr:hypothetical protein [Kineococcus siccus]
MILAALLAATPSPSPSTTPEVDADLVTPGLWGFVALFFLALAVYFLGRSMARRVRRVNQRARIEAELQEEESRADGTAPDGPRSAPTVPAPADEDPPGSR